MKKCAYCGATNGEAADVCRGCGQREFAPKLDPVQEPVASVQTPLSALIAVKEGATMVLKCRTPWEAILVAQELEAVDILAIVPDTLTEDYKRDGYAAVKVSAEAYERAKELQYVIERRHWEDRTKMPLPWAMKALAVCLPPVIGPGWVACVMICQAYARRGYDRKMNQFGSWFFFGVAFWFILLFVLVVCG